MRLAPRPLRRSRVPLTSLVDVVLCLLFFFMLTSQYLDWRVLPVDLAEVAPDGAAPSALTVLLLADGGLRLGEQPASVTDVIAAIRADAGTRPVMLVPARGVSVQATVDVLDALAPSGARVVLGRLDEAAS
ncbi:MAG: Biopolymer transport protein ExbD/TolR [Panacagrimonas sp.]|jgi:biopolymer transport protein ExbD|nr:biopolymer transporter ExbD [Panacagrimonas sp.]MCC2655738.1 Biopolymer transport protein ExbD/TolR [Panacagrimonas sp.]